MYSWSYYKKLIYNKKAVKITLDLKCLALTMYIIYLNWFILGLLVHILWVMCEELLVYMCNQISQPILGWDLQIMCEIFVVCLGLCYSTANLWDILVN